jgi:hypothetical protein
MGLFDALLTATIHVATSPLDVVKDVVTLGGTLSDEESAIAKKMKTLGDDINKISDSDNLF